MISRNVSVCVRASAEKPANKVSVFRKKVEAKRNAMLKENINKLAMIASVDSKFVSDTFQELDVMHRKFFEDAFGKTKKESPEDVTSITSYESDSGNSADTDIFRD